MLCVARAGQIEDRLVEGDQDTVFVDGQAEEEGVRDLLMSVDPVSEWFGERGPAGLDGPVSEVRIVAEASYDFCRLNQSAPARGRACGDSQKAGFSKSAYAPSQAG